MSDISADPVVPSNGYVTTGLIMVTRFRPLFIGPAAPLREGDEETDRRTPEEQRRSHQRYVDAASELAWVLNPSQSAPEAFKELCDELNKKTPRRVVLWCGEGTSGHQTGRQIELREPKSFVQLHIVEADGTESGLVGAIWKFDSGTAGAVLGQSVAIRCDQCTQEAEAERFHERTLASLLLDAIESIRGGFRLQSKYATRLVYARSSPQLP